MPHTLEKSGKIYSPKKKVWNIPEPLRLGLDSQEWGFFRLNPVTSTTMKCGGVSAVRLDPNSLLYGIIIHIQWEPRPSSDKSLTATSLHPRQVSHLS